MTWIFSCVYVSSFDKIYVFFLPTYELTSLVFSFAYALKKKTKP